MFHDRRSFWVLQSLKRASIFHGADTRKAASEGKGRFYDPTITGTSLLQSTVHTILLGSPVSRGKGLMICDGVNRRRDKVWQSLAVSSSNHNPKSKEKKKEKGVDIGEVPSVCLYSV